MNQKEKEQIAESKAEKKGFETSMKVLENEIRFVEDYINKSHLILEKHIEQNYDKEEREEDEMLINKAQAQLDMLWKVCGMMLDTKNSLYF